MAELALIQGYFEASPDAVVVTDGEGLIVLVNAQAEVLFGYPRAARWHALLQQRKWRADVRPPGRFHRPPVHRSGLAREHCLRPQPNRNGAGMARTRSHRRHGYARYRPGCPAARSDQADGRAHRDQRLRRRLLVARQAQAPADRHAQCGPLPHPRAPGKCGGQDVSDEPWTQLLSELRHSRIGCAVSGIDGLVVGCKAAWNSVLGRPEPDSLGRHMKFLLRATDNSIEAAGAIARLDSVSYDACEFDARPLPPGDCARRIAVSVARFERAGVPPHFFWQIVDVTHRGQTLPAPTASFGVAKHPTQGAAPAVVLKAADRALYRAKGAGRDQVCAAGPAERLESD